MLRALLPLLLWGRGQGRGGPFPAKVHGEGAFVGWCSHFELNGERRLSMSNQTAAIILGKLIARLRLSQSFLWRLEARIKGVEFQGRVQFQGRPIISLAKGGRIVLGNDVSVASARRANPLGLSQPSV